MVDWANTYSAPPLSHTHPEPPSCQDGTRTVTLSPEAVRVIAGLPRAADTPWVIAGPHPGTRITNLSEQWRRVRARADLEDVRLHDLRHSWASRALARARACR